MPWACMKKVTKTGGTLGFCHGWITRKTSLPTLPCQIHCQTVRAHTDVCRENGPIVSYLSRLLKVTGTDTNQSATHDFLLVIRNKYGPISFHFEINCIFGWKSQFFLPHAFNTHWEGFQRNFVMAAGSKNTRMMPLPDPWGKCLHLDTFPQHDGWTDIQKW